MKWKRQDAWMGRRMGGRVDGDEETIDPTYAMAATTSIPYLPRDAALAFLGDGMRHMKAGVVSSAPSTGSRTWAEGTLAT